MVNSIIARIKQGSIKSVVLFSDSMKIPPPPYVVVKPEAGAIGGTRQFRVIVHMDRGHFIELDQYTLTELDSLLLGGIDGEDGGRYMLYPSGYTDVTADAQGDTYFMERTYYTPITIRR